MSAPYRLVCPHCNGPLRIRTSEGTHVLLRTAYLQCANEACGFCARAQFEITHELSPSAMPNPTIKLPVAPVIMRRQAMAKAGDTQLDMLAPLEYVS